MSTVTKTTVVTVEIKGQKIELTETEAHTLLRDLKSAIEPRAELRGTNLQEAYEKAKRAEILRPPYRHQQPMIPVEIKWERNEVYCGR